MKVIEKIMERNDCYIANQKIEVKGIMIHSTATPGIMAGEWFEKWNRSYKLGEMNRQVCVHAFLDDKEIYQYLPWDHRGWHAGGVANNTHIGIEICEPAGHSYSRGANMVGYDVLANEQYFKTVFNKAVDLCVYLCKLFNLTENDIITHCEGYELGIASNHGDVMHWFIHHNESMDTFREAVRGKLRNE